MVRTAWTKEEELIKVFCCPDITQHIELDMAEQEGLLVKLFCSPDITQHIELITPKVSATPQSPSHASKHGTHPLFYLNLFLFVDKRWQHFTKSHKNLFVSIGNAINI